MTGRDSVRTMKRRLTGWLASAVRRPALDPGQLLALRPARILIVRQHNQMGDMVCATPALRAIRETWPQAEIALVTAPVNRGVVAHNPHLDRIFTFAQRLWRNPVKLTAFLGEVRRFRPDLALVLASVSFSATSAAIALASGARYVVGADSRPFGLDISPNAFSLLMPAQPELDRHAVAHSLAPLEAVGITTDDHSTVVVPSADEVETARKILGNLDLTPGFWALHPGAGKEQNLWPAHGFAAVAERALADGQSVLVLHGPVDAPALTAFLGALDPANRPRVKVAPQCPVGVGAALLAKADRFLCNDTGIMHVAGALHIPTVALFGPTDPALWKPPAVEVQALRSPHRSEDPRGGEYGWMETISTDAVWAAWRALPGACEKD